MAYTQIYNKHMSKILLKLLTNEGISKMLQLVQRGTGRNAHIQIIGNADMNLQIGTKLDYPESSNQLHFTGHNLFAFLWIQEI